MIVSSIPIIKAGVMTNSPYLSLMLSITSATAWEREENISSCSLSPSIGNQSIIIEGIRLGYLLAEAALIDIAFNT